MSYNIVMNSSRIFDTIVSYIVIGLIFLLPLFFLPASTVSFGIAKSFLFIVGTLIALMLWVIARLKDDEIVFPAPLISGTFLSLPIVVIISALCSPHPAQALFTNVFEINSPLFITTSIVVMFLIFQTLRDKVLHFYAHIAFFASCSLLLVFHILRTVFGASFLALDTFSNITVNVVGKWNDLAVFFGLAVVVATIALHFFKQQKKIVSIAGTVLALALLMLVIINFSFLWYILAGFSLIFFVYVAALTGSLSTKERHIPVVPLITLVISLIFILDSYSGLFISSKINQTLSIPPIQEIGLSWPTTFEIVKGTLAQNFLTGAGPQGFDRQWLVFKPDVVNLTDYWNIDFTYGSGFIPTFAVTAGILGILAWLAFIGVLNYVGYKTLFNKQLMQNESTDSYLIISTFFGALYLWTVHFFYIPSVVTLSLAFILTALYIVSIHREKLLADIKFSLHTEPIRGFISMLGGVALLLITAIVLFVVTQKYIASIYFQKGLQAKDIVSAEQSILQSSMLEKTDTTYRALSQIYLIELNQIINNKSLSQDDLRTRFQKVLGAAAESARNATTYDATNYMNWLALATVYQSVISLNIPDAYEGARDAYKTAQKLNPKNPAIELALAQIEIAKNNTQAARDAIARALTLKPNYTDAVFLLSQIEIANNNVDKAIANLEAASLFAPNDPTVFYQLGLLRFSNKNYTGAISALENAVAINTYYANARYYLGLSYDKLGRSNDALAQFLEIEKTNPDNQDIVTIINRIKGGQSVIDSSLSQNTTNNTPAKKIIKTTPPVKDKIKTP